MNLILPCLLYGHTKIQQKLQRNKDALSLQITSPYYPWSQDGCICHSHGNNTDIIIQTGYVTLELILGVRSSGHCDKCIIACGSHCNLIQNTFHTPQSLLYSPAHPPSSLTLAANDGFKPSP